MLAGSGEAGCSPNEPADAVGSPLYYPRGVAVLGDGSVLFSEQGCHRIRLIDGSNVLSTYAGTGEAGYSGDGLAKEDARFMGVLDPLAPSFGISTSPEDPPDEVYIADTGNNLIREINLGTGRVETVAGTGEPGFVDGPPSQARFDHPTNVFASSDHAVWVVDTGNHAIRRIDPLGTEVRTIAGTGTAGFSGDGGPPDEAQLNAPGGVWVTRDGAVYVADTGNHRVRLFRFGPN